MSEQLVVDQLSRYGTWLEGEVGLALKGDGWSRFDTLVAFDGSDETDGDLLRPLEPVEILAPVGGRDAVSSLTSVEEVRSLGARVPRGARTLVGASVLLLVVVVGGLWLNGQLSSLASADLPPDPPGALFVLPDPDLELELSGERSDGPFGVPDSSVPLRGYVFAIAVGDVFHHPVSAWISEGEPHFMPGTEVVEHPAPGGPALVSEFGPSRQVVQQRDEFFLSLTSSTLTTSELLTVLGELEMNGIGRLVLSESSDLTLMDSVELDPAFARIGTSAFDAIGEFDGSITIETANVPSGAMFAGFSGGQWSRWEQGGRFGWEARETFEYVEPSPEHEDEVGPTNGLIWQATPNRAVLVSGQVSIEDLHKIIRGLRIVSEDEWREAFEG